ncbi:MAG TPA: ribonuclease R, partial [Hyphomicrobiaceae bacterium]|nr:ribonuclease R [Hyphomicrobiaceae bacterium]
MAKRPFTKRTSAKPVPARRPRGAAPSGRVPTKEEILEFIQEAPEKVGKREISRAFHIKGDDRRALKALLSEMSSEGLLVGNRREIRKPGVLPPVTVLEIIRIDSDGELIAEPVVWNTDEGPRPTVLVETMPVVQTNPHHHRSHHKGERPDRPPGVGDRILARISALESDDPSGAGYTAETIKRLPRERRRLLGIFRAHSAGGGT